MKFYEDRRYFSQNLLKLFILINSSISFFIKLEYILSWRNFVVNTPAYYFLTKWFKKKCYGSESFLFKINLKLLAQGSKLQYLPLKGPDGELCFVVHRALRVPEPHPHTWQTPVSAGVVSASQGMQAVVVVFAHFAVMWQVFLSSCVDM